MSDPALERVIRPTNGSFVAFSGFWIVLSLGYGLLALVKPGRGLIWGALLPAAVAGLSLLWMNGHRLWVSKTALWYRDGFYRMYRFQLGDIREVRNGWLPRHLLGRELLLPRLQLIDHAGATIVAINAKPFPRETAGILRSAVLDARLEIVGPDQDP